MSPIDRIKILQRFVRLEGYTASAVKMISSVAGKLIRFETVYLLDRSVRQDANSIRCRNDVVIGTLERNQIDKLEVVAYCGRQEIERRLDCGQKCLVASLDGDIIHYSWLTASSEYAGEVEMTIPVTDGETYLYNCRTLRRARGWGVFPVIIGRALVEAEKMGASSVIALVSQDNKPSLRSFEKMGFVAQREIRLKKLFTFRKHEIRQIIKT